MKRWAVLTVVLYALALALLTVPVLFVAFGLRAKGDGIDIHKAVTIYLEWGYWLWLGVFVAGQVLLLLLPVRIAERRLRARRPLKTPVIVSAFFLATLVSAGILSTVCAIFGDNVPEAATIPILVTLPVFWLVWAVVFCRATRADEPDALMKRVANWLLRGSILELLVAVPSHVIVRRRGDCCAPVGTFWGIATGLSVMLLCFGPGVFFLFVERCRRLQPKPPNAEIPPPQE